MAKTEPSFIDIHTHILPGVDDGAADLTQAIALLQAAWEDHIRGVFLTPHYRSHYHKNTAEHTQSIFQAFCREVKKKLPGMELYLGAEIRYKMDISEKLVDGTLSTLNASHYVLLEFRQDCARSRVISGVLEVVNFGYTPIIVHPERYDVFLKNKSLVEDVLDLGALIQVNAGSLLGKNGFAAKRFCRQHLKKRHIQFVATDCHDLHKRPPRLSKCYRLVRRKCGESYANALFYKNAREVITGGVEIE